MTEFRQNVDGRHLAEAERADAAIPGNGAQQTRDGHVGQDRPPRNDGGFCGFLRDITQAFLGHYSPFSSHDAVMAKRAKPSSMALTSPQMMPSWRRGRKAPVAISGRLDKEAQQARDCFVVDADQYDGGLFTPLMTGCRSILSTTLHSLNNAIKLGLAVCLIAGNVHAIPSDEEEAARVALATRGAVGGLSTGAIVAAFAAVIGGTLIAASNDDNTPTAQGDPLEDLIIAPGEDAPGDPGAVLYVNANNLATGTINRAWSYNNATYSYDEWIVNPTTRAASRDGQTSERVGAEAQTTNTTATVAASANNQFFDNVNFTSPVTFASPTNSAARTVLSGNINFQGGATFEPGTNLVISPGTTISTNTPINIAAGSTVLVNGASFNVNTEITTKSALVALINTRFGNWKLDPTFTLLGGTNTPTSMTLGTHTPEDSWNTILMYPGSQLNVANALTLNNQNVLVVGYNASSITTQALSDLITASVMQGGNGTDSGRFDTIFTLGLNDDGTSTGILQPVDATITNSTGTYRFDVAQSTTGVKLSIASGAEPDSGSNLDSVVQQLLAANPTFAAFLNYNSTASSFSFRLDSVTTALTNAAILARSGGGGAPTDQVNDEFRFAPVILTKNMSPEKKLESILTALAEGGPISKSNNEYRVWVSPFSNQSNVSGSAASRSWLLGSLVGTEYRSKSGRYTLGLLGGMNFGSGRDKGTTQNGSNLKGVNMGAYAAWGAWEGGRIDGLYVRSLNWIKTSRFAGIEGIALNDSKATIDVVDFSTSHVFKIPGDIWSVRFNLGHTYSHTDSEGYREYNVARPRTVAGSVGRSYEVYGGIGLRYNKRMKDWRTRITSVYEYGKEYKKAQSRSMTTHFSGISILNRGDSEKAKTHYATLYGSLNNSEGWKFVLGYQGAFKKNSTDTSIYAKAEYRF